LSTRTRATRVTPANAGSAQIAVTPARSSARPSPRPRIAGATEIPPPAVPSGPRSNRTWPTGTPSSSPMYSRVRGEASRSASHRRCSGRSMTADENDAARVTGSFAQAPGQPGQDALDAQLVRLSTLRERTRVAAGVASGSVAFVEDDIADSSLEPSSFDTIVSFEVLEHVLRPAAAFGSMARLLRPGGTTYHVYNPFFSVIGGHSLCTLDFPWGHARLDAAGVERYVTTLRPGEADQALRFYREALNRMTLSDLRVALASSGLDVLAIIPWFDRATVPRLSPTTVAEVRRAYPDVTIDDLLATFVTVVARRPG